jgi:glycosyltransferase involved in cell wall biosynthesis
LKTLIPVMKRLQSQHPKLTFRFIGAGTNFSCAGLHVETPAWSEQLEVELLAECDIGIMPLPDTEFMRSKCGLKLIQYMACGLPVVASPVGVNTEIVEEGRNGYLASSEDEWFQKLDKLIRNPEIRMNFGNTGRAKVEAGYTLEQGFCKWQEVLEGHHVSKDHSGRVEECVS